MSEGESCITSKNARQVFISAPSFPHANSGITISAAPTTYPSSLPLLFCPYTRRCVQQHMFYKLYDLFKLVIKPEYLIVDATYGRYLLGYPKILEKKLYSKLTFIVWPFRERRVAFPHQAVAKSMFVTDDSSGLMTIGKYIVHYISSQAIECFKFYIYYIHRNTFQENS